MNDAARRPPLQVAFERIAVTASSPVPTSSRPVRPPSRFASVVVMRPAVEPTAASGTSPAVATPPTVATSSIRLSVSLPARTTIAISARFVPTMPSTGASQPAAMHGGATFTMTVVASPMVPASPPGVMSAAFVAMDEVVAPSAPVARADDGPSPSAIGPTPADLADQSPTITITSPGAHPGDAIPNVYQGSGYKATGETVVPQDLLNADGPPNVILGYRLVSETWTYPQGAVKGYGTFTTGNAGNDPDGNYVTFASGPTANMATGDPSLTSFTTDDRDHIYAQDQPAQNGQPATNDHIIYQFYFGPASSGNVQVSVTAVWNKVVNDQVAGQVQASDTVTLNVIPTTGNISLKVLGTPGLSLRTDDGTPQGLHWIGLDRDSHTAPDPNAPNAPPPMGIQYSAQITSATPGQFTVVQTKMGTETLKGTDPTGAFVYLARNYFVDPNTGLPRPDPAVANPGPSDLMSLAKYPALDTIPRQPQGMGYGFRINTSAVGPNAPPPNNGSASVFDANGVPQQLWGQDRPGTPLGLPKQTPTKFWTGATWTRSEAYTLTLMYNPDPNSTDQLGGAPGNSIWIPVGTETWSYSAGASFGQATPNPNGGPPIPQWFQVGNSQPDPGTYAATTNFPAWFGWIQGTTTFENWWNTVTNTWY